jgi:hypothetical protein
MGSLAPSNSQSTAAFISSECEIVDEPASNDVEFSVEGDNNVSMLAQHYSFEVLYASQK